MRLYETLAILLAADQSDPENLEKYEARARFALSQTGITHTEMDQDFPDAEKFLEHALNMMFHNPREFDREAKAAIVWRASRN